jgi:hypothetical protein
MYDLTYGSDTGDWLDVVLLTVVGALFVSWEVREGCVDLGEVWFWLTSSEWPFDLLSEFGLFPIEINIYYEKLNIILNVIQYNINNTIALNCIESGVL